MIRWDRRRDDHGARARDMSGIMSLKNRRTEGGDVLGPGGIAIASADCNSPAAGNEREGAHPGTADSHEVDRSGIRGVEEIHP
jgi:hypothetical protein